MKQIEVRIMGINLMLGCPENKESELLEAANIVDSAMCAIRDAGKTKARERVAVLAALNIAVDGLKKPQETALSLENTEGNSHATASDADASAAADSLSPLDRESIAKLITHIDQALAHN